MRTLAKDVHVHLCQPENEAVSKYRDLRDWLRTGETDRAMDADTRKMLAPQRWADMNEYAENRGACPGQGSAALLESTQTEDSRAWRFQAAS